MEMVEASERQTNADRVTMLKQAKEALAAHLNRPRLTPELVLGSADDALSAASKLVDQPVVPQSSSTL